MKILRIWNRDNFYNEVTNVYNTLKKQSGDEFTSYLNSIEKYEIAKTKIYNEFSIRKIEKRFENKQLQLFEEADLEKKKINEAETKLAELIKKIKEFDKDKIFLKKFNKYLLPAKYLSILSVALCIGSFIHFGKYENAMSAIYIVCSALTFCGSLIWLLLLYYFRSEINEKKTKNIENIKISEITKKLNNLQQKKVLLYDEIDMKLEEKITELKEEQKQKQKYVVESLPEKLNGLSKIYSELKQFYDKHEKLETFYKLSDSPSLESLQAELGIS